LEDRSDRETLLRFRRDVGFCIGRLRLLQKRVLERFDDAISGMNCRQFPLPRGRGRSLINCGMIAGPEAA